MKRKGVWSPWNNMDDNDGGEMSSHCCPLPWKGKEDHLKVMWAQVQQAG